MPACTAVIPAAGKSTRAGVKTLKQFHIINGKPVLWHAAQPFLRCEQIAKVRVVIDGEAAAKLAREMFEDANEKVAVIDGGGDTRAKTVANGIAELPEHEPVLIHDAARPCVTDYLVRALINEIGEDENGGLLAIPAADAMKKVAAGKVKKSLSRNNKWRAQTPQLYRAGILRRALAAHPNAEDESAAMQRIGFHPRVVRGRADNIKITDGEDMRLAELILTARAGGGQ